MGFIRKVFKKAAKGVNKAVKGIGKVFDNVDPKALAATLALNFMLPGLGSMMSSTMQAAGASAAVSQTVGTIGSNVALDTAGTMIASDEGVSGTKIFKENLKGELTGEVAGEVMGAAKDFKKVVEVADDVIDNLHDEDAVKVINANEISDLVETVASKHNKPRALASREEVIQVRQNNMGANVPVEIDVPEEVISDPKRQFIVKGKTFSLDDYKNKEDIMNFAEANNLDIRRNKEGTGIDLENPFILNRKNEAKTIGFFGDRKIRDENKEFNLDYGKINWDTAASAAVETTGELALDYGISKYLQEDYDKPVGSTGFISPEAPQEQPQSVVLDNLGKSYMNAGYQGPVNLQSMSTSPYFGPGTVDYLSTKELPLPNIPLPS
jgi:hypothetical protein|tara:strand:- start:4149 stop:5291 length:1143 start_codon:yes stop_codon:yes gene_type:complete